MVQFGQVEFDYVIFWLEPCRELKVAFFESLACVGELVREL